MILMCGNCMIYRQTLRKEYEPVVTELKTELARLQEQYNDPVRFSPDRDKE